ncbi:MAG TPA: FAD-dependent oxidoreductase, partial [Rhodanobacteraceae bacterium]|nr:FAD-dependent oxidoreductase [Rhodanobacteraceae bacterium]
MSRSSDSIQSDVLILGGGVIGLSCALALARTGASVRVLEQAAPGAGASHGNCGTLTPSHAIPLSVPGVPWKALRWMTKRDAPLYVKPRPDLQRWRWLLGFAIRCNARDAQRAALARAAILQRSHELLPQWLAEEGIDCEYAKLGTLYVYRDARALDDDRHDVDWLNELGVRTEILDPDRVTTMEPALKEGIVGGVWHPDDAQLRPNKLVEGLTRRVREHGVVIENGARIEGFVCTGGSIRSVRTSRGEFAGKQIVMALGAWSPKIARHLHLRLPIQPGKGYSITTSLPDPAPQRPLV